MHILELTSLLIEAETTVSGGRLGKGAIEVGLLLTVAGLPGELALVGQDAGSEGGSIVAAEADEHDAEARHGLLG